jgi:rRNA maturation RNase YbeY
VPQPPPDAIDLDVTHDDREVDLDRLRDRIRRVLAGENARLVSLGIVLAGHDTVRRLNRDYLDHDYDTDVLSFSLRETAPDGADAPAFPAPAGGAAGDAAPAGDDAPVVEGEVYVDLDTAAERHAEFDASFEKEVHRYAVHGVLHLCGYDDATEAGAQEMRRREDRYLAGA